MTPLLDPAQTAVSCVEALAVWTQCRGQVNCSRCGLFRWGFVGFRFSLFETNYSMRRGAGCIGELSHSSSSDNNIELFVKTNSSEVRALLVQA